MDNRIATLSAAEFAPETTYLNTASSGLLPARATDPLRAAVNRMAAGTLDMVATFAAVDRARAAFGRLAGVPVERVAVGTAVSTHVGMIAASLPTGAEVLVAEGDFSSVVNPFTVRGDLKLRTAPLESLAGAVDAGTALIAVSAVQSADGRIADLAAIREAAREAGARTLIDTTQATGWLPLSAAAFDYTVCGAYKWLLCPRGTSFLTVSEEARESGALLPLHAGWVAAELPWDSCYGPISRLAPDARRFDESVPFLPYLGAEHALSLVEELGQEAIGAHNRALAARFREGLRGLGYEPVREDSAVVAVPGLGHAAERLSAADVKIAVRDGNLRVAFHLYNTDGDVSRVLDLLAP
ncbi:aminotransferase class V-fold PLP-dependent enzyme [Streptomyces sp. NPDC054796]